MISNVVTVLILSAAAIFIPHGKLNELSSIQLYTFPLIAAFLIFHPWFSKRIPREVVLLATFFGILSYGPFWSGAKDGVAVATLKGDAFSSKTRIVRDMIQDSPKYASDEGIGILYKAVSSDKEARALLGDGKHSVLIWGEEERIKVSIANQDAYIIEEPVGPQYETLKGFRLVQSIPAFYLSFSPQQNTVDFIGGFLTGLVPTLKGYLSLSSEEAIMKDSHMKDVADMLSRWTNFTHRSVPYFHLGTRIIASELKRDRYDAERLNQALKYYETAASFLMWRDDPELKASIFNNSGIIYLMKYGGEGKKEYRKKGRKFLKTAHRFAKAKSPFGVKALKAPRVAKRNLSILKEMIQRERGVSVKRSKNSEPDPLRPKKKRDKGAR